MQPSRLISAPLLPTCFLAALALASAAALAEPAPGDGDWPMAAGDAGNTRFSALEQITTGNVDKLRVAFTFPLGVERGQEAAPIVVGDTMYIVTPFPNWLYALDLRKPDAPLKWKFDPKADPGAQGVACCDVVNRGAAYSDGRVFYNTLDAHTIAVDAATGRELWRTKLGEVSRGETVTMAPLVVRDKVLVGNSGGELGVRGWLTALDAATGRIVWRAWSTGPDSDVLIGPDFKPPYDKDRGKDLGVTSWPGGAWKIGGGNVWGFVSYDAKLDLLYHGTGNPGPWNPE
jgi:PQQ-dependent dehydrogenase (methanol/ethanol family)